MDITSIRLLKLLIEGQREVGEILDLLGIKERWLSHIVKNLEEESYIKKTRTTVRLKETPKVTLLRDVIQIVDVEKLLLGSTEAIISHIHENTTVDRLIKKTGLSKATVYRSISDLQSIGAIRKDGDTVSINEAKERLNLFIQLLNVEKEKRYEYGNTEIIYDNKSTVLRKVPRGKTTQGVITGFSLFSNYEIEYQTTHDYFCEQEDDLEIHDVLAHAVYSANYAKNKMELLMCAIFYIKNKDNLDVIQLRKKASKLGIREVWLDVEAYIRRNQLKNPDLFLPWEEFLSKAELYSVPSAQYILPTASDSLFGEISDKLQEPMTIYLFGGENMRIKSLKDSTKDCDFAVENKVDFDNLAQILTSMEYKRRLVTNYSDEDKRINPDDIFEHEEKSRIDLFTSTIMHDLSISPTMKEMADIRDYGKLKVGLLRNEHVFILKAMTSREGDIQDMAALVTGSSNTPHELQHGSFDWNMVWIEILKQEHINHTREFAPIIFEHISYLAEQTGIVAPFLDKLRRHVVDRLIKSILRGGSLSIKQIVDWLNGAEINESMIRNRIDMLEKIGNIEKHSMGRTTHVRLLKDNEFVDNKSKITSFRFENYLNWRFVLRKKQSSQLIRELVDELKEMGFRKIGVIDMIIRNSTEVLKIYEAEQFSSLHFDVVGAIRICVGLNYPEMGTRHSSKYFISKFEKYNIMTRDKFIPKHPVRMVKR